jgi:phosphatidylinositol glycan class K
MLADDVACNPRNRYPATVFNNRDRKLDLYGGPIEQGNDGTVEVDYRGYEVTVESFIRLLTGRHDQNVPRSKRLMTDDRSNVLVFMTGHGGDEFLKFQDAEEISSHDIADAFQQMNEKKRYNEVLFMVDTCQANTLYSQFYSPNILASGSSKKGQNSLSHHVSHDIGVAVIDRYTYYMLEFMEEKLKSMSSQANLKELFDSLEFYKLNSHVGVREDLFRRDYSKTLITDFFGNIPSVEVTFGSANLNHQKSDNSLISPNIWRITSTDFLETETLSDGVDKLWRSFVNFAFDLGRGKVSFIPYKTEGERLNGQTDQNANDAVFSLFFLSFIFYLLILSIV